MCPFKTLLSLSYFSRRLIYRQISSGLEASRGYWIRRTGRGRRGRHRTFQKKLTCCKTGTQLSVYFLFLLLFVFSFIILSFIFLLSYSLSFFYHLSFSVCLSIPFFWIHPKRAFICLFFFSFHEFSIILGFFGLLKLLFLYLVFPLLQSLCRSFLSVCLSCSSPAVSTISLYLFTFVSFLSFYLYRFSFSSSIPQFLFSSFSSLFCFK